MNIQARCLALAYPERIAKNRGGGSGAFLLANGRGAQIDPASPLAREPFLAVAELAGSAAAGRILLAAPITLAEIEARFSDRIEAREEVTFDAASLSLRGRRSRRLGALVLSEQPLPSARARKPRKDSPPAIAGVGIDRLPWTKALRQWRDRVMFLRASEGDELARPFRCGSRQNRRRMAGAGASLQKLQSANSQPMNWTRH